MTSERSSATPVLDRSQLVTVLLIEDDNIDVIAVQRSFRAHAVQNRLLVAQDGLEALRLLRDDDRLSSQFIVIMDLNMPLMGGHQFLTRLRKLPLQEQPHVIVVTTSSDPSDKKMCMEAGVTHYLHKSELDSRGAMLFETVRPYLLA